MVMKRFRSTKSLFVLRAAAVLVVVFVASSLRIIQLHYPREVENNPLLDPIKVQSVSGSTLLLEDGRTFHMHTFDEPLEKIIEESGFLVDVDTAAGEAYSMIYVKRRGFITCGLPWTGVIEIPLIPDDVPRNHRELLGLARAVATDGTRSE